MSRWRQIMVVALIALLLVGCQPPTVAEVRELDVIQLQHGDILPMLTKEATVTFTNGRHGKLAISWDILEGHEGSAQVWEDMTIKGYIKSGPGHYTVTQLIEVAQPETLKPLVEGEIVPPFPSGPVAPKDKRDPMENLASLEVNWSGIDISPELKEELRALLFRTQWITRGNFAGNTIRVSIAKMVRVNGQVFFRAADPYFYTYKDFHDFIEGTYTGDLLDHFIESEKCVEVNEFLYYWGSDGLGFSYGREGPWRMKVVEITDERISVELSQTIVYSDSPTYEDVSEMEFLFVNGRWLISKQGFKI